MSVGAGRIREHLVAIGFPVEDFDDDRIMAAVTVMARGVRVEAAEPSPPTQLRLWWCGTCGYVLDDTDGSWTAGHEDDSPEGAIPPDCSGEAWDAAWHPGEEMVLVRAVVLR